MNIKLLSFILLLSLPWTASGVQMRENTPEVLTPPPQAELPDTQPIIDAYAQSYARQLRPRIVVFWNRDFGDEVVTSYRDVLTANSNLHAGASANASGRVLGNSMSASEDATLSVDSSTEIAVESRRIDPQVRQGLTELVDWKVEGLFMQTLLNGGTRLVDREVIFRSTGRDSESNQQVNRQKIEMDSLIDKADLLMEVFLAPDYEAKSGVAFRVSVTDINTGVIVAHLYTPASPPTLVTSGYQATNRGFQKVETESEFETVDIGKTLALRTMEELSQRWNALPPPDAEEQP